MVTTHLPLTSPLGAGPLREYTVNEECYLRHIFFLASKMSDEARRDLFWRESCQGPSTAIRDRMRIEYEMDIEALEMRCRGKKSDSDIWWDAAFFAVPLGVLSGVLAIFFL
jgi:hypothetical protein